MNKRYGHEVLYIRTVFFIVYRTRKHGRPLAPGDVLGQPARGLLHFAQGPHDLYGRGVMLARLLDPNNGKIDVIPSIEHAQIERLHEYVHIRGIEHYRRTAKARVDRWDQTWICCVTEEQCARLMDRAEARVRAGRRLDVVANISAPSPLSKILNGERSEARSKAFHTEFDRADEEPWLET